MPRGRKPKLTPELIEQAAKLIEAGAYQREVAWAIGVSEDASVSYTHLTLPTN